MYADKGTYSGGTSIIDESGVNKTYSSANECLPKFYLDFIFLHEHYFT